MAIAHDQIRVARATFWVTEVGIDDEGEVSCNSTGLNQMLDANARLLAKGKNPAWWPIAIAMTPEAAEAAGAAFVRLVRERKAASHQTTDQRTDAAEPAE